MNGNGQDNKTNQVLVTNFKSNKLSHLDKKQRQEYADKLI
jgi:hypothetical protein